MSEKKTKIKNKLFKLINNIIYFLFNVGLIIGILFSIDLINSVAIGMLLIVIAKWRVFAVKPRFWLTNIKSGLVDYIIGFSYVVNIYLFSDLILESKVIYYQTVLSLFYLVWLNIIKHKTNEKMTAVQSLIAIFWSSLVMVYFFDKIPLLLFLTMAFIIGYFSSYHFVNNYNFDRQTKRFVSGFWGFSLSQLLFISWHWNIGYNLFNSGFKVSQLSLIATILSYLFFNIISLSCRKNKFNLSKIAPVVIFSTSLILIIILFFSDK